MADARGVGARERDMEVVRARLRRRNGTSELYSPPRIALEARKHGLRRGFSLDRTVPDKDGYVWDFSKPECRKQAWAKVVKLKPFLPIGSPPCSAFRILQNLQQAQPGGHEKGERDD